MIIIPDLFTPYIEGTELARKANWDDLNNYNQVQKGQLSNAFDLATFAPRVNERYEITDAKALENLFNELTLNNRVMRDAYATRAAGRNDVLGDLTLPGLASRAGATSRYREATADAYGNLAAQGELAGLLAALNQNRAAGTAGTQTGASGPSGLPPVTSNHPPIPAIIPTQSGSGTPISPQAAQRQSSNAAATAANAAANAVRVAVQHPSVDQRVAAMGDGTPGAAVVAAQDAFTQAAQQMEQTQRLNELYQSGVTRDALQRLAPGSYMQTPDNYVVRRDVGGQLWLTGVDPQTGDLFQIPLLVP